MDSAKIVLLEKMLPEMIKNGDRILIFSQFVIMLDILEDVFNLMKIKFQRLDGSTPGSERLQLIDKFNDTAVPVFLLSTKACGLGINLTTANTVILYDIDFNPHNDIQAEDRAHRVGQTKTVKVYRLIVQDTIEQHMLQCANYKLLLDLKVQDISGAINTLSIKDGEDDSILELLKQDLKSVY